MLTFLEKMGKQILNIAKPKKRVGFVLTFVIVAIVVGLGVLIAPAARAESEIVAGLLQFFGEIFLTLAGWFIQGTLFVLKFVIEVASYNAYIQSGPVTLGWVLVRDVANMFFVVILMVIAFGTVLGLQQYEWQKLLVKFILAAILVNFSRVICGVIIDASQVFMMTFISAVAATAGGNLISLFSLDKTLNMAQTTASESVTSWNVLVSAIAGCAFAFTAMVVTGAYLWVLLARVVTLWSLIILSPLAFILRILPQTATYAARWWKEFSSSVISGPVVAFFLWLSFAVAGGANVHNEFASAPYAMDASKVESETGAVSANENVVGGLSEIMKWDNMASFIIAIALMLAGVKVAQELGAAGAGALGAAAGAAGKFAMVASGAAAARWAVGKAAEGAKKVAVAPAKFVGGAIEKRAESLKLAAKAKTMGGMEWWNRQVVERGVNRLAGSKLGKKLGIEAGGGTGLTGFVARRLQFGSTAAKLETRKKIAEDKEKLYKSSIVEPTSLKMEQATVEARLEQGAKIKEGVVKGRLDKARKAVEEQDMSPQYEEVKDENGNVVGLKRRKLVDFAAAQKAKAERIEVEHKRHDEEANAAARDEERLKQGKSAQHLDVVRARHTEEDQKFYASLPYEKVLTNIQNQRQRLKNTTDPGQREAIVKDMNDQIAIALQRGASFGPDAIMKAIDPEMIKGRSFSAEKPQDQQALLMSALLQRDVKSDTGDIKKAADELTKMYGKRWDAFSSHLSAALKSSANSGAVQLAGLMKITEDGKNYEFTTEKDKDFTKTEQDYAVSKSRGKPENINMAVDRKIDGQGKQQLYIGSQKAMRDLAVLMPSSDLGAKNMLQATIAKLEVTLKNTLQDTKNKGNVQAFVDFMRSQHADSRAIQSLFNRFTDETKKLLVQNSITVEGSPGKGGQPPTRDIIVKYEGNPDVEAGVKDILKMEEEAERRRRGGV